MVATTCQLDFEPDLGLELTLHMLRTTNENLTAHCVRQGISST